MALFDRFRKTKNQEKPKAAAEKQEPILEMDESKPSQKKKPVGKQMVVQGDKAKLSRAYQIILEPHITEKAASLEDKSKYFFKVSRDTNKSEIKKAIELLYSTKVDMVHIIHGAAKKRRLGRRQGWRKGLKKGFKKAIVTLKKGEKIEVLPR